jgi:hypothetical protein
VSGFDLEKDQGNFSIAHRCEFHPVWGQDKAGVAPSILGLEPIIGLRHPTLKK